MKDAERLQLLYGPYRSPRCRLGRKLFCERRGWVTVRRISNGRIAWPQTIVGRNASFILCGDLVKAVRRESEIAIRHWWGVCASTVWNWRKCLGVSATTEGTTLLRRDYFHEPWAKIARAKAHAKSQDPERRAKIAAAKLGKKRPKHVIEAMHAANRGRKLSDEHRKKLSAAQRKRGTRPPKAGRPWTPEEEALLGTMPDGEVAKRIGRTLFAVQGWRARLNIDGFYRKRKRGRHRAKAVAR